MLGILPYPKDENSFLVNAVFCSPLPTHQSVNSVN